MIWNAKTPDGQIYWATDLTGQIFGSPLLVLRLREAAETGIQPSYNSEIVPINLGNAGDVRLALEVFYGQAARFSETTPEATKFSDFVDPNVIY